jgi:hypothetical protein
VQEQVLYIWSGEQVKRMVPGFRNLAADLYWLRTVQYFGEARRFSTERRFDLLEPLTEITTTLDPRLEIAYRYGATFLSEPQPVGAGRPRSGVALLERGVANIPGSWRLRQDLGFFTHFFLHEHEKAARILVEASELPGAAFWLKTLAAQILDQGGNREASRRMWQTMYEQAEGDFIKHNALQHLLIIDTADQADRLTEAVREYERRFGHLPENLAEVAARGLAHEPVVDKAGTAFEYDPKTGLVTVARASPYWRPNP